MAATYPPETFVNRLVKYALETDGGMVVIENVPARVCLETGEQLFAPETVEKLQRMVAGKPKPKRILQVPVFDFA